jgi:hypothetical protein
MRRTSVIATYLLFATIALSGCRSDDRAAQSGAVVPAEARHAGDLTLPTGTSLDVTLGSSISSASASVGDAWSGSTTSSTSVGGHNVIPSGSGVSGTVSGVTPAHKGDRAMLDLQLTKVTVGDRTYHVRGGMESVVAGSTRARNLGAIAGSAVAGAIIGKAVGGTGKGALIGGVVGGGVATGVVAESKGWQVVLKQGTPLTFATSEPLAVRP